MAAKKKTKKSAEDEGLLTDKERIAERLRKARDDSGLTQAQLATQSGIGRSAIVHYENAKAVPGGMELIKLANTLDVTPNHILSGSEQFHESTEPEHALATEEFLPLMMRVMFCLMALDRDVRESVSVMLMSLVKQKLPKKKYENFVGVADAMGTTLMELIPDIEGFLENLEKEGHFDLLGQKIESITQEKKE